MKKSSYFLYSAILLIASCVKENSSTSSNISATQSENIAKEQACNAAKADAENINIFPNNNAWNIPVSWAPVDAHSDEIIANFSSAQLKADFGSGLWQGAPIGIPYVVVCGTQQKYNVVFRADNEGEITVKKVIRAPMPFR